MGNGKSEGKEMFSVSQVARKIFLAVLCGFVVAGVWLSGCREKASEEKWSPHYREAVKAYRQGDYAAAVSLFEKALLYEPSNAIIYLDIGAIYEDFLGDVPRAISYYEKYLAVVGEGENNEWVKSLVREAKKRLTVPPENAQPKESEGKKEGESAESAESLRERLRTAESSLDEEKRRTEGLLEEISALKARQTIPGEWKGPGRDETWFIAGWVLCGCLAIIVLALMLKHRHAEKREDVLLAGIRASASGGSEEITKGDILGKYFWVENDRSGGLLSFTETGGKIHVCVIDGETRLRSRGKGQLVGSVLTADLRGGGEESVLTKFIFANKGRTVTAVWEAEEGTCIAAGIKSLEG